MSNETVISIAIAVIFGVAGLVFVGKKNTIKVNNKAKSGNIDMSNTTIGNEVNINKDDKKKK